MHLVFHQSHFMSCCISSAVNKQVYYTSMTYRHNVGHLLPHLPPLTPSPGILLRLYTLPYWSNPSFLIFDIRVLCCSVLSTGVPECQKIKIVRQTSTVLDPSNSSSLEQLALKGLKQLRHNCIQCCGIRNSIQPVKYNATAISNKQVHFDPQRSSAHPCACHLHCLMCAVEFICCLYLFPYSMRPATHQNDFLYLNKWTAYH